MLYLCIGKMRYSLIFFYFAIGFKCMVYFLVSYTAACGEISVSYGTVHSVSADGSVLKILCKSGYEINRNTTTCLNGSWSDQRMMCTPIPVDIGMGSTYTENKKVDELKKCNKYRP